MITLLKLSPYTGEHVSTSPNYDTRNASAIEGIVLHATADDGDEARSLAWLCSPKSRVSCHLMVSRAGRVTRLVGDRQRAWHAGLSWWRGTSDVNSITLGIELANRNDGEPYTAAQYARVAAIVSHYCAQGLSVDDVVGHEEIAEGRKTDPLGWDWDRFRAMVQNELWVASQIPAPTTTPSVGGTRVPEVPAAPRSVTPPNRQVPVTPRPKCVLKSRTLWLNALTVLAAAGLLIPDAVDLAHQVGIQLSEELMKWALFAVGLVNIVLRVRTTRPLTCGPSVTPLPPEASTVRSKGAQVMAKEKRKTRGKGAFAV